MRSFLRHLGQSPDSFLLGDLITCSLLPLAFLTSLLSYSAASLLYSNLCRAGLGLGLSAWLTYITDLASVSSSPSRNLSLPHFGAAALTLFLFPSNTHYNTYTIYWAIICLRPLTLWLVSKFPQCFSFGEATLICQSCLLISASLVLKILSLDNITVQSIGIQLFQELKWLVDTLLESWSTVLLLLVFWTFLVLMAVGVVVLYNKQGWPVNTKTRKLFHLAVVLVYASGLMYSPLLLYLSSIGALILMISIEVIRWSEVVPPVSDFLTEILQPFLDSKDSGSLILTNIYLLVGVSWPLWVYPGSLVRPPSPLVLYCGVISVGIADSAASIVGSSVGRVKWGADLDKTVEGSLAAVLSSLLWVYAMSGVVVVSSWTAVSMAVLSMVLTEALSRQVDNLTLPLIMYSVLTFAQYKQI